MVTAQMCMHARVHFTSCKSKLLFQPFLCNVEKSQLRSRLHGIGSKWDRIHLDLIHFLRGVYTGSDPELLASTRDRIHLDFELLRAL